ncbi:MAG: hypothetical protein JXA42_09160 [Anaerolineales bacterium]|nr:hypothetical protein [Anaerolineales bacterium]
MYDIGVIHGRFQPLHLDHLKYLSAGMEKCAFMYVGITNPDPGLTRADDNDPYRSLPSTNPCTYYERLLMLQRALTDKGYDCNRFCIVPFPINLPELWRQYVPRNAVYFLTIYDAWGERKLELLHSAGLKTDVLWRRDSVDKGIKGADLRRRIATGKPWEHLVPQATCDVIRQFNIDERIRNLLCRQPPAGFPRGTGGGLGPEGKENI